MFARTLRALRRLRSWWRTSPRARRLPGALLLPTLITTVATPAAVAAPSALGWLYAALAVAGFGFGVWTVVLVLTGRDSL
jgi:hypothetical protein